MSWIDQRPDDAMDGAFTAVAPEPVTSIDPPVFREAMARLGAAVHVVTSAGPAGRTGFTATAVCSVSDQPAMLLVCLNRKSRGGPILRENKVFCINTLGADGEPVATAMGSVVPVMGAPPALTADPTVETHHVMGGIGLPPRNPHPPTVKMGRVQQSR